MRKGRLPIMGNRTEPIQLRSGSAVVKYNNNNNNNSNNNNNTRKRKAAAAVRRELVNNNNNNNNNSSSSSSGCKGHSRHNNIVVPDEQAQGPPPPHCVVALVSPIIEPTFSDTIIQQDNSFRQKRARLVELEDGKNGPETVSCGEHSSSSDSVTTTTTTTSPAEDSLVESNKKDTTENDHDDSANAHYQMQQIEDIQAPTTTTSSSSNPTTTTRSAPPTSSTGEKTTEECVVRRQATILAAAENNLLGGQIIPIDQKNHDDADNKTTMALPPMLSCSLVETTGSKCPQQQQSRKNGERTKPIGPHTANRISPVPSCSSTTILTTKTPSRRSSRQASDSYRHGYLDRDVTSPLAASRRQTLYTVKEFEKMREQVEQSTAFEQSIEEMESATAIASANSRCKASDTTDQGRAMYGRVMPQATNRLLRDILKVKQTDLFVDIGHGIGYIVLQAAFTIGARARGVELVSDRHDVAMFMMKSFNEWHHQQTLYKSRSGIGPVEMRHGRLEDPKNRDFVVDQNGITKAFCNNFAGVFAERCNPNGHYCPDSYLAGLLAVMKPGSKLATLHPLPMTVGSRAFVNESRARHGLPKSDLSSFYELEEVALGKANEAVSWSFEGGNTKNIIAYVYTRVRQGTQGESAVYLCTNPKCERAKNGLVNQAAEYVNTTCKLSTEDNQEEERLVLSTCSCNQTHKWLRTRR